MESPLVSIITVSKNNAATIEDTLRSVDSQDYDGVEHILVDGRSSDGTADLIASHGGRIARWVSEPDGGMYEAMNKGIELSSGHIIGFLHADDVYTGPSIIRQVADAFRRHRVNAVYGDIAVTGRRRRNRIVRYYSSKKFRPWMFRFGFMPAHPSFFATRDCYDRYGLFKTDYRIAADYELLLRFLQVHGISSRYLPLCMVRMTAGGISNRDIRSRVLLNREILRACKSNGFYTNTIFVYMKYLLKIFEWKV